MEFAEILLNNGDAKIEGDPPIPKIASISSKGVLKVEWNSPIFIN